MVIELEEEVVAVSALDTIIAISPVLKREVSHETGLDYIWKKPIYDSNADSAS